MGFGIESATVGYDVSGMQSLINDINVDVIPTTTSTIRQQVNNCRQAIDEVWAGQSAEAFKTKLSDDTETLCKALNDLADSIESQLNQIGANVEAYDQDVADKIKTMGNN